MVYTLSKGGSSTVYATNVHGEYQSGLDYQLGLLRNGLAEAAFPGYPDQSERLVANIDDLDRAPGGQLILPDGSWTVNEHPNRPDTEVAPTLEMQEKLVDQGLELDSLGRPLHPWFKAMIEDPAIGVITGKGSYWRWGPGRTADPIVEQHGRLLVVQRQDTGEWAFPGGFVDPGEDPYDTAIRELNEETGVPLTVDRPGELVYEGPVADIRMAQGWPVTSAFLFRVASGVQLIEPRKGSDPNQEVRQAAWQPIETLLNGRMFGAHSFLLREAVKLL